LLCKDTVKWGDGQASLCFSKAEDRSGKEELVNGPPRVTDSQTGTGFLVDSSFIIHHSSFPFHNSPFILAHCAPIVILRSSFVHPSFILRFSFFSPPTRPWGKNLNFRLVGGSKMGNSSLPLAPALWE